MAGPMLIVLSAAPKPRFGDVVNQALESHPNFGLILAIAQGKLAFGVAWVLGAIGVGLQGDGLVLGCGLCRSSIAKVAQLCDAQDEREHAA